MKLILGVIVEDMEVEEIESTDVNDWILKPREIGKMKKQIQVIVKVIAVVHIRKLVTNVTSKLLEEELSLKRKTIVSDHTVKVGIIVRLNLRFISKQNYEIDIYKKLNFDERVVELKKDVVYEKEYR